LVSNQTTKDPEYAANGSKALASPTLFLIRASLHLKLMLIKYGVECEVLNSYGFMLSKIVKTSIYLISTSYLIQLIVMHKRGDYLWFGDDHKHFMSEKIFGDIPRALNRYCQLNLSSQA
jgi:hypothetical protein